MRDRLAFHPFFHGLDTEHLTALEPYVRAHHLPAGTTIFKAGRPAEAFRLIESGTVALRVEGGHEPVDIETIGRGEVLGLSWIGDDPIWAFGAVARTEVALLEIPADRLLEAMDRDHDLRNHVHSRLVRVLLERLQAVRLQRIDLYGGVDVR